MPSIPKNRHSVMLYLPMHLVVCSYARYCVLILMNLATSQLHLNQIVIETYMSLGTFGLLLLSCLPPVWRNVMSCNSLYVAY